MLKAAGESLRFQRSPALAMLLREGVRAGVTARACGGPVKAPAVGGQVTRGSLSTLKFRDANPVFL